MQNTFPAWRFVYLYSDIRDSYFVFILKKYFDNEPLQCIVSEPLPNSISLKVKFLVPFHMLPGDCSFVLINKCSFRMQNYFLVLYLDCFTKHRLITFCWVMIYASYFYFCKNESIYKPQIVCIFECLFPEPTCVPNTII